MTAPGGTAKKGNARPDGPATKTRTGPDQRPRVGPESEGHGAGVHQRHLEWNSADGLAGGGMRGWTGKGGNGFG